MLKRSLPALVAAMLVAVTSMARAQDEDKDGIRRPERLTVGTADQLLGQLSRDKRTLYFVSNRNTTNEIFYQGVDDGRSKLLFDEGAEVTWPQVSPSGKAILYISYADRANGELCVREVEKGIEAGKRHCHDSHDGAPLLATFIDDKRILLVERATIDGNLRVLELEAGGKLASKLLFERNLTSPTISPDGKWLIYVPLERSSDQVGPAFAAHAAQYLEAIRLDQPKTVVKIDPDLPGLTGQPAFSKDGKWVFFVQFFSDSNHDGVVDASDHGVLFRAPLENKGQGLALAGPADQLTDETWNCQYPAPSADRLLMTCSRGRNLDLYTIPLEGEVPSDWDATRLQTEIDLAGSYSRVQLLNYQRLVHATTPAMKRFMMFRLVRLHLAMQEFEAAEFYAKHIAQLGGEDDKAMAEPLLELVKHRRLLKNRERGRIVEDFDEQARKRLATLAVDEKDVSASAVLRRVIRSEIADTMGDKGLAKKELEAVPKMAKTSRSVMEAYYERADALYRELDDREGLVKVCTKLATDNDLPEDERLVYARAAVRAMIRGLPYDEAVKRLAKEKAEGELGFAIELGTELLAIRGDKNNKEIKQRLIELYQRETRVDRRRAIMLDSVERATQFGADPIVEGLAEHYVESAANQEQRRAQRLYTQTLVGRAFRRRAADRLPEARADFEAVAKRTGALEAVVGAVDLRLRAGENSAAIQADFQEAKTASFVKSYLLSRELVKVEGKAHERISAEALAALQPAWPELKKECMGQALRGSIVHQQYLDTGDLAAAERAGTHYLVALELAGANLRYKAMVLSQLGILHTQVGNFRIALGYLEEREKLPYAENSEGLAVRLALARSYLHAGSEGKAASMADEALGQIDQPDENGKATPAFLMKYRPLVLDRAALYNLAANRFERALKLYEEELKAPSADPKSAFRMRIAHAAAALGADQPARALDSLEVVEKALNDESHVAIPKWAHADVEDVVRAYRLIASGLRARSLQKVGQFDAAAKALEARKALLSTDKSKSDHGEYVRLLMLAEAQLADNAVQRKDAKTANTELSKALVHSDELHARAQGAIDTDQLDVILFAAQTAVNHQQPIPADVAKRMETAHDELSKVPDAKLRTYRSWLEIYLAMSKQPGAAP